MTQVNVTMIAHHTDLNKMVTNYTHDDDFAIVYVKVAQGQEVRPYTIKDGSLMYGSRLCITKCFRNKVWKRIMIPHVRGITESNLQYPTI